MATTETQGAPLKLLRLPAVRALVGLSKSTIYLKVSAKEFPSPISLGMRAVAWDARAIEKWIAERIANASHG